MEKRMPGKALLLNAFKKELLIARLCLFFFFIGIMQVLAIDYSQFRGTVTGMVIAVSGEPLPGVTVLVKGTTHGTITDANGNYTLTSTPPDAVLIFSFVGMEPREITVNNQSVSSLRTITGLYARYLKWNWLTMKLFPKVIRIPLADNE